MNLIKTRKNNKARRWIWYCFFLCSSSLNTRTHIYG